MAGPKSITPDSLASLGAPALAAALVEHAEGDPILRKKLRMLLAGTEGPAKLAAELAKRIQTIGRSRSVVDWEKAKALARELDHIRTTLRTTLAVQRPDVAIERLWDFIGIADRVLARVADGASIIEDVFGAALDDLGQLIAADPDRDTAALVRRVRALWDGEGFGSDADVVAHFGDALGAGGRAALRRATETALAALPPPRPDTHWHGGSQRWSLARRLMILADLDRDPDAYVAAVRAAGAEDRLASDIAERLIEAGRPGEALDWLDTPRRRYEGEQHSDVDLRIAALAALGRTDAVLALRWATFEQGLSAEHLRAHLKALPDFEDFQAEQKALAIAAQHDSAELALEFLVGWPALDRAATLVRDRLGALDGRAYEILRPAAEALEEKYPDAATLLYRHLVDSVLDRASTRQYPYAARDLVSATSVAGRLPPDAQIESGPAYLAKLRRQHGRKHGFWALIGPEPLQMPVPTRRFPRS
jgi:thioesterase domain-containing protein